MLQAMHVKKRYGEITVLDDVSFVVNHGERVAVVGPNGAGKTTLLRILAGHEEPDAGRIVLRPPGARIGYLAQALDYQPGQTVGEVLASLALMPFSPCIADTGGGPPPRSDLTPRLPLPEAGRGRRGSGASPGYGGKRHEDQGTDAVSAGTHDMSMGDLAAAQRTLRAIEQQLATASDDTLADLLAAYDEAEQRFAALGGYSFTHRMEAALARVGLVEVALETPVDHLSGGQQTRLGLARLLLAGCQVLLLDEPTNHLDIAALTWLEEFLCKQDAAILLVSHDRAFLDRVAQRILELDLDTRRVTEYAGNYSAYVAVKQQELAEQWRRYNEQQRHIARIEDSIRRLSTHASSIEHETINFHYRKQAAKIARRAVTQRRALERLRESEDLLERPEEAEEMRPAFIGGMSSSGQIVLTLDEVAMGWDGTSLFAEVSAVVRRGERLALMGPNGSGKTTLLRIIAGILAPSAGSISLGAGVEMAYYTQQQEHLPLDRTPLEVIRLAAPLSETQAWTHLAHFSFTPADIHRPVRQLSLGQRARLALAELVASGRNLLLLDEPFNHLDIATREGIERALKDFGGTVIAATHDRYFMSTFATRLWRLEEGRLLDVPLIV
jgi:ATP-binding cassette subfamily F protein 3